MKSVSVAAVQHDLKSVLKEVESGGVFRITRHGRPVAYLSANPPPDSGTAPQRRGRGPVRNPCLGALAGTVRTLGDIVGPEPEEWEANR